MHGDAYPDIESEAQNEESPKEDSHKDELPEMNRDPTSAAGISREHDGVVIGRPTGVKEGHDSEKHFSDDHQRARQTKQAAVGHDEPPACLNLFLKSKYQAGPRGSTSPI
jgi:hypothetical protein